MHPQVSFSSLNSAAQVEVLQEDRGDAACGAGEVDYERVESEEDEREQRRVIQHPATVSLTQNTRKSKG